MTVSPTELSVAFAAGFVSFVSPCVWPLIPGYLSFVSGVPGAELGGHRRRVTIAAVGFVAGFTAVFTVAGAGTGVLGSQFLDHRRALEVVGGALVVAMGVVMLMPAATVIRSSWKLPTPARPHGPLGAAATGAAFGVAWTPCIGAQLASILAIAGTRGHAGEGALLLAVYGLGLGVPFLLAGMWLPVVLATTRRLRDNWGVVTRVSGALLIVAGLMLASGRLTDLTARLAG
ncbi:MAG TPA: cytochrome c biogenesis protein CcdA [Gaiellales bacterium]|nr:cytochrome c biogenesis protein CcdA [Gaiellales bacterium]